MEDQPIKQPIENTIKPSTDDIYCNIIDWQSENIGDDEDKRFIIRFFGRTNNGLSLTVSVTNFFPFFYVKIPRSWTSTNIRKFIMGMKAMSKDHGRYIFDYVPMEWKDFYGFKGDKKFNFLMIRFQTSDTMRFYHNRSKDGVLELRIDNKIEKFQLYESNLDPMLRFMHVQDIKSCGWIKLPKGKYRNEKSVETYTDYHLRINAEHIISQYNFTSEDPKLGLAKFKICSFDLECYSHDDQFPQSERKEDPIIQIGMVFYSFGDVDMKKYILTLKQSDEIDDVIVRSFRREEEVLLEFQKIIQEEDPDILTGYNIYGFDEKYINGRVKLLRLGDFGFLSRIGSRTKFKEDVKLSSAALGDNLMHYYDTIGRVQIDLMKLIQKDFKLNSYKLDSVSEHFMKEIIKKIEIKDDKTKLYLKKKGEFKIGNFIKVSEEDDVISDKLKIIDIGENYIEIRGNLSFILDNETIEKNTKQHLYFYAGMVKDDMIARTMFQKYEGGNSNDIATIARYCIQDCVLPIKLILKLNKIPENMEMASISSVPMQWIFLRGQGIKSYSLVTKKCRKRGFLIKVLPRLHREEGDEDKVGYEGAIVLTPEPKFHRVPISVNDYSSLYPSSMIAENISHEMFVDDEQYDNLPEYTYNIIKFDQESVSGGKEEVICKYAKKEGEFGVIPEILNDLLTERKAVRKLAEAETDIFMKAVYEGRQLALKLTANSLYGQIGAGTSPICYVMLAASTTAVGRGQIMIAKNFVEKDFKDTLMYIYENKDNKEKLHEFLTKNLKNKAGKTLADDEKEVNKVICKISEVFDKYDIAPKVVYGDSVANYTPIIVKQNNIISIIPIESLGSKWSNYNNSEKESCELFGVESWTEKGWSPVTRIIRHKLSKDKKMIRVITKSGIVDVTDDHSLIKINGEKASPKNLQIGDALLHLDYTYLCNDVRITYINSFDKHELKHQVKTYDQLYAAEYGLFMNRLGYELEYSLENSKIVITMINNVSSESNNQINEMYEIPYSNDEYVYDLTTKNHHFQAGVGHMIVHNTDSIFNDFVISDKETGEIVYSKQVLQPAIELGILVSKFVQSRLRFPHELSYEKTFFPFAIFSKKRYVGNKYTDDDKEFTMTSMGIVLKRRDNAPIVKKVIGGMIDIMMNEIDCDKTIIFSKKIIRNIFKDKYPIKDFVTSKTIKDINKYKTTIKKDTKGNPVLDSNGDEQNIINIAHVMLAQKMIKEKRANAPQMNDRVPFAYIEVPKIKGQKVLQGEKIEHPEYIVQNNLKIDYMFYITNQIMLPAIQFLELVTAKPEDATELFNDLIKEEECRRKGEVYKKSVSLDRWLL
jgi:DNA polymerase elongation subunit (family B)